MHEKTCRKEHSGYKSLFPNKSHKCIILGIQVQQNASVNLERRARKGAPFVSAYIPKRQQRISGRSSDSFQEQRLPILRQ